METANIVIEYIRVLIYPAVLVVALLLFKKEIAWLLRGRIKAQYKDLVITLERQRKTVETMRDNQAAAVRWIASEAVALSDEGSIADRSQHGQLLESWVRHLLALTSITGYWDNDIIRYLRKADGPQSENGIIQAVTKESDPWAKDDDEHQARSALKSLIQQGILVKDSDGKLHLHTLFADLSSGRGQE